MSGKERGGVEVASTQLAIHPITADKDREARIKECSATGDEPATQEVVLQGHSDTVYRRELVLPGMLCTYLRGMV
jgi:hypothetical protein